MWDSDAAFARFTRLATSALACLLLGRAAVAADAAVYIRESTFNDFAAALVPISVTGHKQVSIGRGWLKTVICDSDYTATVTGISFIIAPSGVVAVGPVSATYCGHPFRGTFTATGSVSYRASDSTVRVSFASASVRPTFEILGITIPLPSFDVAPSLNIPPMKIGIARIRYDETADGSRRLVMRPQDISLVQQTGYIVLQSNLSFP